MSQEFFWTYGLLIGQAIGVIGGFVGVGMMLVRRAKEREEKRTARDPLTPPATPVTDPRDWRGAPASKPR